MCADKDGNMWTIEDTYYCSIMRGATKIVLIPRGGDYVIKLNIDGTYLTERECDLCGLEYPHIDRRSVENVLDEEIALYESAPAELKEFIKPNIYVGDFNNIPVYVQEKIGSIYENVAWSSEERYKDSSKENHGVIESISNSIKPAGWSSSLFPDPFINDVVENFGEAKAYTILMQLKEQPIFDFNYGNFGYDQKNIPCLIDIGDFSEDEFFSYDE